MVALAVDVALLVRTVRVAAVEEVAVVEMITISEEFWQNMSWQYTYKYTHTLTNQTSKI